MTSQSRQRRHAITTLHWRSVTAVLWMPQGMLHANTTLWISMRIWIYSILRQTQLQRRPQDAQTRRLEKRGILPQFQREELQKQVFPLAPVTTLKWF